MVEWKKLGDVCSVFDGTHQTPKYTESGVKFVSVENIDNLYFTNKYISKMAYSENYKIKPQKGDVLMTRIGDVGRCAIITKDEPIAFYVSLALLRPNPEFILCNYLKHIIESKTGRIELRKRTLLTAVPLKINLGEIGKIRIPIPSLEEQKRIVGILDTFTDSIENLKQQIAQRRKQYEHYRDQLLFSFERNVIVSDVSTFAKGRIDVKCLNADNYVSVENLLKDKAGKTISSVVPTEGNWVMYKENDILIGNIRPYLRKIWFSDRCGGTNGDVLVIRPNEKVIPRFLFFVLSSERFFIYYNQTAKGGKMPRGEKARALQFDFYLPSTKEQSRIVSILDTFEASISNLEAQLAQRQKQYEYYRNQLLTFE